jgi:hypothetical protein
VPREVRDRAGASVFREIRLRAEDSEVGLSELAGRAENGLEAARLAVRASPGAAHQEDALPPAPMTSDEISAALALHENLPLVGL